MHLKPKTNIRLALFHEQLEVFAADVILVETIHAWIKAESTFLGDSAWEMFVFAGGWAEFGVVEFVIASEQDGDLEAHLSWLMKVCSG